jgi:aspartate aminotransferase-like enzyme
VYALVEALRRATPERMERIRTNAAWLRNEIRALGLNLLAPEAVASPGIVTIVLDRKMPSAEIGEELEMRGFWLSYRSNYLLEKNWIQIALLGDPSRASLEKVLTVLRIVCGRRAATKTTAKTSASAAS